MRIFEVVEKKVDLIGKGIDEVIGKYPNIATAIFVFFIVAGFLFVLPKPQTLFDEIMTPLSFAASLMAVALVVGRASYEYKNKQREKSEQP